MGRITGARGDQVIREPDFVAESDASNTEIAQAKMLSYLGDLATRTFDESRPVDEYQSATSTTSLEVLPEFELDELIESIVVVANPYTTMPGNPGQSSSVTTAKAAPGAGDVVTTLTPGAGIYTVNWSVSPAGGAHANNFGLYNDTTLIATSNNPVTAGTYLQPQVTVVMAAGKTLTTKAILADAGVTYTATTSLSSVASVPVGNLVTIAIGHRSWVVDMSAWGGVLQVKGMKMRLSRQERRIFTQTVAGPLSVEMTGHADTRGGW